MMQLFLSINFYIILWLRDSHSSQTTQYFSTRFIKLRDLVKWLRGRCLEVEIFYATCFISLTQTLVNTVKEIM